MQCMILLYYFWEICHSHCFSFVYIALYLKYECIVVHWNDDILSGITLIRSAYICPHFFVLSLSSSTIILFSRHHPTIYWHFSAISRTDIHNRQQISSVNKAASALLILFLIRVGSHHLLHWLNLTIPSIDLMSNKFVRVSSFFPLYPVWILSNETDSEFRETCLFDFLSTPYNMEISVRKSY